MPKLFFKMCLSKPWRVHNVNVTVATSVSGDVSGLAPLTQLTQLYLHSTSVSGDVSGLAPLTQLRELRLHTTSVSGDVSGLAPLTQLRELDLSSASVCGQRGNRDYGTC
jgi:hypothetical protein